MLVLHLGGNDFGVRPFWEVIQDIKFDLLRLWALFPHVITWMKFKILNMADFFID